jgi:hypothetical protein
MMASPPPNRQKRTCTFSKLVSIAYGGRADLVLHANSQEHKIASRVVKQNSHVFYLSGVQEMLIWRF